MKMPITLSPLYRLTLFLAILAIIYLAISFAEKNSPSPKETSPSTARFIDNGNGTISDTETNLMWATRDNGKDTDFQDAEIFCKSFSAGGYTDWRMPDIEELETLYATKDKKYKIVDQIRLSSCCPWSSYDSLGSSSAFNFQKGKETWGFKQDTQLFRALPVREISKERKN